MIKLLRKLFLIDFFFTTPYYIARGNTLYYPNGQPVPTYNGNDRKWHPNWEELNGSPCQIQS